MTRLDAGEVLEKHGCLILGFRGIICLMGFSAANVWQRYRSCWEVLRVILFLYDVSSTLDTGILSLL